MQALRIAAALLGIQIAPPKCPLDLGGLTLHRLSNVTAAASLDWLATFATTDAPRGVVTSAVTAAGTIADAGDRDPDARVKRQAVFALSQLPRG